MQCDGIGSRPKWRKVWDENWKYPDLELVEIFVAYCSQNGVDEIVTAHLNRKPKLSCVLGINNGVTDLHARDTLLDWAEKEPQVEIKTRSSGDKGGIFHPKVYVFHYADMVRILIGSINLTHAAFSRNTEAAIEWKMKPEEWRRNDLRHTLEAWWESSPQLRAPSVEERIIDTMKCGVLVNVGVHLATTRHILSKTLFELQPDTSIQAGFLSYEKTSTLSLALTGEQVFKKLEYYRMKAHQNCSKFAFRTDAGLFVPQTAIEDWKKSHRKIEKKFKAELEKFTDEKTRKEIRQKLKQEFRTRIEEFWWKLRKQEIPNTILKSFCDGELFREVEEAYDKYAHNFPQTVVLSTEVTPYVLPYLSFLSIKPNLRETIKEFNSSPDGNAGQIVWGTELSWMITLIRETREQVVLSLEKWLSHHTSKSADKWRKDLGITLQHLNFYGDNFCDRVKSEVEFVNHPNRREVFKKLRVQARADLEAITEWPLRSPEEVRNGFARLVGW